MELVYLWVEDYKNIHRQGFNFSPRFECKFYDEYEKYKDENEEERERLKDDCILEICDKKKNECEDNDYVENFFEKNINITAIVGKNGSGKSNIVKLIYELIFTYFKRNITNSFLQTYNNSKLPKLIRLSLINFVKSNHKAFLIIKNNQDFFKIDSEALKSNLQKNGLHPFYSNECKLFQEYKVIYNNQKIKEYINKLDIFSIYYNYSLDSWQNRTDLWVETVYHKQDNYQTPLLIEPDKKDNIIDLNSMQFLTNQRVLLFYSFFKEKLINKKITSFFNPNKVRYNYAIGSKDNTIIYDLKSEIEQLWSNKEKSANEYENIFKKIDENYYKIIKKYINYFNKIAFEDNIDFAISLKHFNNLNEILKYYNERDYKKINLLYIFFKLLEKKNLIIKYSEFNDINTEKLEENFKDSVFKISLDDFFKEQNFEEIINNISVDDINDRYEIKKIVTAIQFHENKFYEILDNLEIKKEILISQLPEEDMSLLFPSWLEVEFLEDTKSINSLSTGEKFKFNFLMGLLYQLYNLKSEDYSIINIFFDEIELGFHPEWQRIYIDEILFTLKKFKELIIFNKKLHLIFLTHSPFLISDLPKENIIFLDKDENGNCKVADGLKEKKQTFGTNIHTLLSDSFFMKDGLMGEFAKSKINEIKDFYDFVLRVKKIIKKSNIQKRLEKLYLKKKENFCQIQKIIGEPFLQKIVKNQLEEIETILFNERAKEVVIERFIKEFGADEILKVLNGEVEL